MLGVRVPTFESSPHNREGYVGGGGGGGSMVLDSLPMGWSGGAMVLGKLPVSGCPTDLEYSRTGAFCTCRSCGWGLFGHFYPIYHFSLLSPSLGDNPI